MNYIEQDERSWSKMIILAVVCTLVAGAIGGMMEPISFSVALPVAVMGGFILRAIQKSGNQGDEQ